MTRSRDLVLPHVAPTTPNRQRHQALTPARFRLFPFRSPLLRESLLLSSPRGTEMFQFPRFPRPALCVQAGVTPHDGCRVSPFGHPRIKAWSAAPRGFSQPPTSFFGFRRQGIHRWLFVAWRTKMLVLALKFSRSGCCRATRRSDPAGRRGLHSLKAEQEPARAWGPGTGRRGVGLQPTVLPSRPMKGLRPHRSASDQLGVPGGWRSGGPQRQPGSTTP